jgi:Tol biopolymer transport system component
MYCAYHTLWVVRSDGRAIRTMPCGAQISPDNRYALYKRDDSNQGLFTLDLTTGEDRYLAVNPDLNTSGPWREPGFWFADSRRYFYTEGEDYWMQDIWVGDITTGEVRNLTQTPERDEIWPMYWPGPDKVLFYSRVKEDIRAKWGI